MPMVVTAILATFPDVWYDTNVNAIVGTASWVIAGLATVYFVLKWLKNSEKFYDRLHQQQER
jgi:hypothetical protein